jgi:hypothetical protein
MILFLERSFREPLGEKAAMGAVIFIELLREVINGDFLAPRHGQMGSRQIWNSGWQTEPRGVLFIGACGWSSWKNASS